MIKLKAQFSCIECDKVEEHWIELDVSTYKEYSSYGTDDSSVSVQIEYKNLPDGWTANRWGSATCSEHERKR